MGTTAGNECYGDVLFAASCASESERLEGLARAFDPASRQDLLALGLNAGWTCLDVGAGTGSLGGWLASVTETADQVTAVDRDSRFLGPLAAQGVNVIEADIADPDFHPGQFDLVHARFVLMHLRERNGLLPRLASWVKPGGLLVVSDSLAVGGETSPHGPYRDTVTALWRMLAEEIGTDRHCAGQYPQVFTGLGLRDIGMRAHLPVAGLEAGFTRFLTLTLQQAKPRLLAAGLPAATYDQALLHLEHPLSRELFFAMVTCWGRTSAIRR
ncbi:bifunctional 2-polyprenyl-6-hydroxyphenol methylase/3-demethylubiquinol 3-O-methyltransferase UbiG [Nocardiopsis sp. CNT312]|uniref:class I SAM-dependent methyltransferase n=1 Tax=Nocardiopsis sp. CNT312 TaxID=1137268 RepID=UPI00048D8D5B|nr:class I SAM-dependent methyltransferase [Nocardiopsis sp. CNT312]